jgi:hypothetical protein
MLIDNFQENIVRDSGIVQSPPISNMKNAKIRKNKKRWCKHQSYGPERFLEL